MRKIKLTQKQVALVDNVNYNWLNQWKWFALWDRKNKRFYAGSTINGKRFLMHRLILGLVDPKIHGEHKDHNGLNNQISNLRKATPSQNLMNISFGRGSSTFKGVSWMRTRNKWRLQIVINGKNRHMGYFDEEMQAANEYNRLAKIHYKQFACLNNMN